MRLMLVSLLFLCVACFAAQDTITMDIAVSTEKTVPIGVLDFSLNKSDWSGLDELPQKTILRDLNLSGRFNAVELAQYNLFALSKAGAKHYVSGELRLSDGSAILDCKLFATATKEQVLKLSYKSPANNVRSSLHQCVDKIIYQLWGVKGYASTQMAWVSRINGQKQVIVADYDGFRKQQVTKHSSTNFMPVWSPDNNRIYFTSLRNGKTQIFERYLGGSADKLLFPQIDQAFGASVNPVDGNLLFSILTAQGGTDIWTGDPKTNKARRLIYSKSIDVSPSWSPKGTAFLFSSDKGGQPQIYMALRDGSDVTRVTFMGKYNESAVWSPDGERIAYCSMENGKLNIYTSGIDGNNVQKLTSGGNNEHPTWSPDGMSIAFSSDRDGSSQIYIMRKDGTGLTKITSSGINTSPTWSNYQH